MTALDLNLFRLLTDAAAPVTVDELAQKTGAEKALLSKRERERERERTYLYPRSTLADLGPFYLGRLLRYLAAIGMVDEVSKHTFEANHASRNMTAKVAESGMKH